MRIYTTDLKITISDKLGVTNITVDDNGISFNDGFCYFSDGCKDYKIPVEDVKYIFVEV